MPDLSMWHIAYPVANCTWEVVKKATLEIRNAAFRKTAIADIDIERCGDVFRVTLFDDSWAHGRLEGKPDLAEEDFLRRPEPDDTGDGSVPSEWEAEDASGQDLDPEDKYDTSKLRELTGPIFERHGISQDHVAYYFYDAKCAQIVVELDITSLDKLRDANKEIFAARGEEDEGDELLVFNFPRGMAYSIHDLPKGLVKKIRA